MEIHHDINNQTFRKNQLICNNNNHMKVKQSYVSTTIICKYVAIICKYNNHM